MADHRINCIWRRALDRAMKPKTLQPCDEWCEENIRLSERFTSRPGPLRLDETPFMRQPHKWFSDPLVSEISAMTSAQVAKTTFLSNCVTYAICEDPGPILFATSTGDSARAWVKREWRPRVEDCPALVKLRPSNPDDYTLTDMQFLSCIMSVIGGQSPGAAASRPIRYVFIDEADKLGEASEKEAGIMELLIVRTRSFRPKHKVVITSTPTVKTGNINKRFLAGSQHRYMVRCPECDGQFRFVFREDNDNGGVKWPDECKVDGLWDLDQVRKSAYYQCPHCSCKIPQSRKRGMIAKGEWIQHNFKCQKGNISFHINTLYSLSWGEVAVLFLTKKDSAGGLQDFHNSDLGEPYEIQSGGVNDAAIDAVVAASPEYFTPRHVTNSQSKEWANTFQINLKTKENFTAEKLFICMTADVQQLGYWWVHRLWMDDESSFLLDYGEAATEEDLMNLSSRRYQFGGGQEMTILQALIDSGYRAKKEGGVYEFCLRTGGKFVSSKGLGSTQGLYVPVAEERIDYMGTRIPLVKYRDDMLKDWLYQQTIRSRSGPGWYLPRNIDATYRIHLQDERLVEKRNEATGLDEAKYVPATGNNHLADCEKMQFVFRELLVKPIAAKKRAEKAQQAAKPSEPRQEGGQWVRDYALKR